MFEQKWIYMWPVPVVHYFINTFQDAYRCMVQQTVKQYNLLTLNLTLKLNGMADMYASVYDFLCVHVVIQVFRGS